MIHLDLQPELEAQFAAAAQDYGLPLPRYIEKLLIEHLLLTATGEAKEYLNRRRKEIAVGRTLPYAQVLP